jgi:branched-subunit amino acid aminotransferase/4-amino-4-deoxychorismate lyase
MVLPTLVSRNGQLIPPAQANVSVFNPALYGAYGIYESLQVVKGLVFAQAAHLDRLAQSAAMLELPLPVPRPVFERWIVDVLKANGARDCVLRILMLGPEDHGETLAFLWPQPAPVYAPELYTQGASTVTFAGQRALPACKSLNTLVSSLARRRAAAKGAHEALLYHNGQLTEGSNSNLFAVVDGQVLTPKAEQVLPGVTRDLALRLAAANQVPLRETALSLPEMPNWSECFITSTSRHIMPVTSIDGQMVGNGLPGPITKRLMGLFEEYFQAATACHAV